MALVGGRRLLNRGLESGHDHLVLSPESGSHCLPAPCQSPPVMPATMLQSGVLSMWEVNQSNASATSHPNQNSRLSSCSLLSVSPVQLREVDMRGRRDGYPHTPCPCVTLRRHLSLLAPFSRWNSARFKQNGSPNLAELAMTAAHASRTEQGLSRQLCNNESRLLSVTYEAQAAAVFIRTGRGRHRKRTQSHCAHFSRVLNHNAIK